ncbi:hypothetical protein AM1BK_43790 [Neobacillus kokaensis]|uniref:Uncharacterized protein n=1 Tax=Neobacillus kokaensis TaxID=2759023 RepID=A0ABQ3N9F2_9BACI|nr:hypothetical protein AM1BK_43790 [Neobacillus kokaensis]
MAAMVYGVGGANTALLQNSPFYIIIGEVLQKMIKRGILNEHFMGLRRHSF